jgi:dTMP kinase
MASKGIFIAIEGGDGSGKGTQSELLFKHYAKDKKQSVIKVSFPRYGEKSAYYISQYLNGAYGTADEVSGDLAGLTYAIDRYAAKKDIKHHINNGGIVIADRYVASNLAHQGTKFNDKNTRLEYYERAMDLEYGIFDIPKPDINIVLVVPTDIAQQNVDKKAVRAYTSKKRDIHEADSSHLDRAKTNYEELCKFYPNDFTPIICTDSEGKLRTIEDIQNEIRFIIDKKLKV